MLQGPLINAVREQRALEVNPHNAPQMGLTDLVVETRTRSTIGELATAPGLACILTPNVRLLVASPEIVDNPQRSAIHDKKPIFQRV
jgi:hypothetical protein